MRMFFMGYSWFLTVLCVYTIGSMIATLRKTTIQKERVTAHSTIIMTLVFLAYIILAMVINWKFV